MRDAEQHRQKARRANCRRTPPARRRARSRRRRRRRARPQIVIRRIAVVARIGRGRANRSRYTRLGLSALRQRRRKRRRNRQRCGSGPAGKRPASAAAVREPYSRTCSRRPSGAVTKTLLPVIGQAPLCDHCRSPIRAASGQCSGRCRVMDSMSLKVSAGRSCDVGFWRPPADSRALAAAAQIGLDQTASDCSEIAR